MEPTSIERLDCPRCGGSPADHLHIVWKCSKLIHYWQGIIDTNNQAFQSLLHNDLLTCALGFLDEELFTPQAQTSISRLLFLARKCILLK